MDSILLSCFQFDSGFKQFGNKYFSDCFLKKIQNWKNFHEKYSLKQYKELSSYANRAKASCSSLFRVESPILPQIVWSKNFYTCTNFKFPDDPGSQWVHSTRTGQNCPQGLICKLENDPLSTEIVSTWSLMGYTLTCSIVWMSCIVHKQGPPI